MRLPYWVRHSGVPTGILLPLSVRAETSIPGPEHDDGDRRRILPERIFEFDELFVELRPHDAVQRQMFRRDLQTRVAGEGIENAREKALGQIIADDR